MGGIAKFVAVVIACFAMAGCVSETLSDGVYHYAYARWAALLLTLLMLLIGSIAAMLIAVPGYVSTRWWVRYPAFVIAAAVVIVIGSLGGWNERASVGPDWIERTVGFWFNPTRYELRLANVTSLVERRVVDHTSESRTSTLILFATDRSGRQTQLPVDGMMIGAARQRIREMSTRLGIPYQMAEP